MKKFGRLELLYTKTLVKNFFRTLFGLHMATYATLSFFLLLSCLVAFNTQKGNASFKHGQVTRIRTMSNTIESSAGGFNSAIAMVVLSNGVNVKLAINRPPLPKVGDTVRIAKHKRVFFGSSLSYVGIVQNKN